jgi:hypothetical protein
MDRKQYNQCIAPYMRGSKPKEQRQFDMCVGAKICSGKAGTEEEARRICSLPKELPAPKVMPRGVRVTVDGQVIMIPLKEFMRICPCAKN